MLSYTNSFHITTISRLTITYSYHHIFKSIGKQTYRTETSKDNHFMYWTGGKKISKTKNWKPPTGVAQVSFQDWLDIAVPGQNKSLEDASKIHQYFRVTAEDNLRYCGVVVCFVVIHSTEL